MNPMDSEAHLYSPCAPAPLGLVWIFLLLHGGDSTTLLPLHLSPHHSCDGGVGVDSS